MGFSEVTVRVLTRLKENQILYREWEKEFACIKQCQLSPGGPPKVQAPTGWVECPRLSDSCWGGKFLAARREEAWQSFLRRQGVPGTLIPASFLAAEKTPMIRATREWATQGQGTCLVLTGGTGCGKTYAAVCALRALRDAGPSAFLFLYAAGFFNRLRFAPPEEKVAIIEEAKAAPLLIFDDLGVESESDFVKAALDEIIYHREGARLSTLITTNHKKPAFPAAFGERAADRILGPWCWKGRPYICTAKSWRRTAEQAPERPQEPPEGAGQG